MAIVMAAENLTAQDGEFHHGDSIRVTATGMPSGKNALHTREYLGNGPIAKTHDDTGDLDVTFTIGYGAPWKPLTLADGSEGESVQLYCLADDDNRSGNGWRSAISITVLPPR